MDLPEPRVRAEADRGASHGACDAPVGRQMIASGRFGHLSLDVGPASAPISDVRASALLEPNCKRLPQAFDRVPTASPESSLSPVSIGMCLLPHTLIAESVRCDLSWAKRVRPIYTVIPDPIVRLAARAPIANRGVETYRFPLSLQPPSAWFEGRHDLGTASATAVVRRRGVLSGDINNSIVEDFRYAINEPGSDSIDLVHTQSPFARRLFAIVYEIKRSLPKLK